jgi:hypothetical protein
MNLVVVTDLFFPDRNLAKEHQNTTQNGPSQTTDTIRYELNLNHHNLKIINLKLEETNNVSQ